MTKLFSNLLVLFILGCPTLVSGAVSITATVDKTDATVEDTLVLTVSVNGSRDATRPVLPDALTDQFTILFRGSSSRIQILNNQMSSGVDHTYLLYPKKPGTFTIGPITVEEKGKTFRTDPLTVRITKTSDDTGNAKDLFITSEVDVKQPFVNQQVIYTFRFFRSIRVANARLLEDLAFQGFYSESLGKEREYSLVRSGKKYAVTEFKQALFPTQPGNITIPAIRLQADVIYQSHRGGTFDDPFFDNSLFSRSQTKAQILSAPKIDLTVKPLPKQSDQNTFSNLVGDFSISTALEKNTLEVGDSTTLTITITGHGNIWDAVEPEFPEIPQVKIYNDKPVENKTIDEGRMGGKIVFKQALVPLEAGTFSVPSIKISYFDPEHGRYKYGTTKSYSLTVKPSTEKEDLAIIEALSSTPNKKSVKMVSEDIFPLHISLTALDHEKMEPLPMRYVLLFVLPVIWYGIGWGVKKRMDRFSNNSGLLRSQRALATFNKELKGLSAHRWDDKPAEFYRLSDRAFKDFLGDKCNVAGSALTADETVEKLSKRNIDREIVQQVHDLLKEFERTQFGSGGEELKSREEIVKNMKTLAKRLEKNFR